MVVPCLLDCLWIPCPLCACMIQLSWSVVYLGAVGCMVPVVVGGMWGIKVGTSKYGLFDLR